MEKEEKKEDPSWKILRRRMVRCPLQIVVQKTKNSARHNRSVKYVKIGETIFSRFFFREHIFNKKSNNEERKHNEKTHKERTKQEAEVKRKSKENQFLFRSVFF